MTYADVQSRNVTPVSECCMRVGDEPAPESVTPAVGHDTDSTQCRRRSLLPVAQRRDRRTVVDREHAPVLSEVGRDHVDRLAHCTRRRIERRTRAVRRLRHGMDVGGGLGTDVDEGDSHGWSPATPAA
jgi:hypothetical protein